MTRAQALRICWFAFFALSPLISLEPGEAAVLVARRDPEPQERSPPQSKCQLSLVSLSSGAPSHCPTLGQSGQNQQSRTPALTGDLAASVDLDECISRLYKKELLAESVIEAICAKTKELLMRESNVVHVRAPVTVVGDIHGQFFDLIEIFKIGGYCPDTNYLFLGTLLLPALAAAAETQTQLLTSDYRRLCRPRHVQRRNDFSPCLFKTEIPQSRPFDKRKP